MLTQRHALCLSGTLTSETQLYYASNLLFVIPLALSKAAVACFLLRLTPVDAQRRAIMTLLSVVAVWGVALFLAITLSCDLSHPWTIVGQRCIGYVGLPLA